MQVVYKKGDLLTAKADALALPVYEDWSKSQTVKALDRALKGKLFARAKKTGFEGKSGQMLVIQAMDPKTYDLVVLRGLGERKAPEAEDLWDFVHALLGKLRSPAVRSIVLATDFEAGLSAGIALARLSQGAVCGDYKFDKYKKEAAKQNKKSHLTKLTVFGMGEYALSPKAGKAAVDRGLIVGESVNLARDLVNEPAEVMTPQAFAAKAQAVARQTPGLTCKVENEAQIKKRKMGLFLAVARGSKNPPKLITLQYSPKNAEGKPIVLVGKGLMYDSGGYSLKPSASMETMKCDMAGSASVLAAIKALAALGVKRKVVAIVAACENMIGGGAYRVGDIFKSMSGKTVYVGNTDAEGRLTLADALSYSLSFDPELVVDVATLTGACVVALGEHTTGLFASDKDVAARLDSAFLRAGEDVWELPLNPRLKKLLKSKIADLSNVGGRWGGAITAGLFLKEFIPDTDWAHLDIAGPAFHGSQLGHMPAGASGAPVASLVELVDPMK